MAVKPVIAVTTWRDTLPTYLYDDTTLHTLNHDYLAALDRAGAVTVLVSELDPADADAVLDRVDGLLVSGGGDFDPARYGRDNTDSSRIDPQADARDLTLIRGARERGMPVLGICRGLQAINVATGGTLHQEVTGTSEHHPLRSDDAAERNAHRHVVEFEPESRLAAIYRSRERKVNSLHHQGIDDVGDGIVVTGRTPDGAVEAIESADPAWPVLGVQWHPEMMDDPAEQELFAAFVGDAAAHRS